MILKFLKSVLRFSLLFTIGYTILLILWNSFFPTSLAINLRKPNGSFLKERLTEVKKIENVDILFLGASTSYMGFDTRFFQKAGFKTFNLGSGAQTPEQTNVLLNRYIPNLNPDLVVYEVLPEMMARDGIEASMELIMADRLGKDIFSLISMLEPNVKVYNLLILKFIHSIFSLEMTSEATSKKNRMYVSGGFVQSQMSFNKFDDYRDFKVTKQWEAREDQLNALDDNLQILRERNIPVLLIRAPITSYKYNSIANNSHIDLLYQNKGSYVNFQEKLPLNDSLHFLDNTHLNQDGIEIFNAYLLNYIKKYFITTFPSEE